MTDVKISWTNSKGETVSTTVPSKKADSIISYLETVVSDVDMVIPKQQSWLFGTESLTRNYLIKNHPEQYGLYTYCRDCIIYIRLQRNTIGDEIMKYPYRMDMKQNGIVWNVLVKSKDDYDYYIRNDYVPVPKSK